MSYRLTMALSTIAVSLLPVVSAGHHSFPLTFNTSQVVDVCGTVVELRWENPHVLLVVLSAAGERWEVESNSIRGLQRFGLTAESIAIGTELLIAGFPARNGDSAMYSSHLQLADGVEHVLRPGSEPRWFENLPECAS